MLQPTEKIWHNGKFIDWQNAQLHVLSHVVSYGSSVFEGIRCYETAQGPAVFRLREHMRRLLESAKIYRIENIGFSVDELSQAALELVAVNKLKSCYIRPIVLRGYGEIGVLGWKNPIETYLACWEWGKYLGEEALSKGVDVCVSSWTRSAPNTIPTLSKAGGNYLSSQLIRMEAAVNGYSEGIALDVNGVVSEGSGENIFVIKDGKIYTPPLTAAVLGGITRGSVTTLAMELGYEIIEMNIPREMLYLADEIFFTGTAAEVTPIRSIDRIQIGPGHRGPITEAIQREFFAIVNGTKPDRHGWLAPVTVSAGVK
ncbi:MAG TPA: branched-chain amino acid transaminase [Bryobacteraceae bacterium]|nr:branched-chain amino acid transaminase [Bryobacteraceae bacterium]